MEKISKKHKALFVCLFFVVCALILTAVIQTFVLKSKQNTLNNLQSNNAELQNQLSQTKNEAEYKVKVDQDGNYVCVKITKDINGNVLETIANYKVSAQTLSSEWSVKQSSNGNYYYRASKNANAETIYEELYFMASDSYNSDYTEHEGTDSNGNSYGEDGDIIIDIVE